MRPVTVVLLVALIVASAGCFPHNAKNRRIAKYTEGASIAAGIGLMLVTPRGADCEFGYGMRAEYDSCRTRATVVGDVGLGLILAGLLGFGLTTATAADEKKPDLTPLATEPTTPAKPAPKRAAVAQ